MGNPNTLRWRRKLLRDRRKVTFLSTLMLDFSSWLVGVMHGKVAFNTLLSTSGNALLTRRWNCMWRISDFLGMWEESYRNEQLLSLVKKGAFPSVMGASRKNRESRPVVSTGPGRGRALVSCCQWRWAPGLLLHPWRQWRFTEKGHCPGGPWSQGECLGMVGTHGDLRLPAAGGESGLKGITVVPLIVFQVLVDRENYN